MTDSRKVTGEDYLPSKVAFVGIAGVRIRTRASRWRVEAAGVEQLQQLCVTSVGAARVTNLEIRLRHWSPPKGWVERPGDPGTGGVFDRPEGCGCPGGVGLARAD